MGVHENEPVTLHGIDGSTFEAVRRGYELQTAHPCQGETAFTSVGEYALWTGSEPWQLVSENAWATSRYQAGRSGIAWATAEELRTRAGQGTFSAEHMDMLDGSLFYDQRRTSDATRLAVEDEDDLRALFEKHRISPDGWTSSVSRLLSDVRIAAADEETENIFLHEVQGTLWLATAQTMVNVFHTDEEGRTYKLRETDITPYDEWGNALPVCRSEIRSSLGETGHITGDRPERPYATAQRGLLEELGLEGEDIASLVSIGSLLRIKEQGHHKFPPLKAEDRTHYFRADLSPDAVRPAYINREPAALIKLEWFLHEE